MNLEIDLENKLKSLGLSKHNEIRFYEKCLVGITSILREAWTTSHRAADNREKIQALSLAKECYSMKLDLLTNASVVDDAMRFVSEHNNKKEEVKEKDSSSVAAVVVAKEETTTNQVF